MATKKTTTNQTAKESTGKKTPVTSQYKVEVARSEAIGHALTAIEKVDAAIARMKATKSDYVHELLDTYISGNQKPLPVKALHGVHAETGDDSEYYKGVMLKLYAATADFADCMSANDTAGTKAADAPLFQAWKEYLALFNIISKSPQIDFLLKLSTQPVPEKLKMYLHSCKRH